MPKEPRLAPHEVPNNPDHTAGLEAVLKGLGDAIDNEQGHTTVFSVLTIFQQLTIYEALGSGEKEIEKALCWLATRGLEGLAVMDNAMGDCHGAAMKALHMPPISLPEGVS
ncbi:MAG: hypothetical protein OIF40_08795 [Mangrovicoccus sp.]|nr:hypothetical protein [Mangrovicoccus sp.]